MANAKQVMDFRPSKGITTAQSNEHQRRWTEKGWERAMSVGNYDPTREHLNFEIRAGKVCPIDKTRSIPERMSDNLLAEESKTQMQVWQSHVSARWSILFSEVHVNVCTK